MVKLTLFTRSRLRALVLEDNRLRNSKHQSVDCTKVSFFSGSVALWFSPT